MHPAQRHGDKRLLFYLVCLYLLVFYYQPGGRIEILGAIRFEFLLGALLLALLLGTRWSRIVTNERMTKAVLLFLGAMTLSLIGAVASHTATEAITVYVQLLKYFSIYIMILGTVDAEYKLEQFVWVFIACLVIIVGEPFLLSLQGKNLLPGEGGIIRLHGLGRYDSANGLGSNALMALPFLYFILQQYKTFFSRLFSIAFGLVSLRVIMLTASRAAYLGLIVLVGIIFLFNKKKMRYMILVASLGFVLLLAVPDVYKERFLSLKEVAEAIQSDERQDNSIGGRWALFVDAWTVFLDYPVFGCGMDSFRRISIHEKVYSTYGVTHNLLMEVLAETGVVGFIAFTFLMLTIWKTLVAAKRKVSSLQKRPERLYAIIEILQILFLMRLTIGLIAQNCLYSNIWWIIGGLAVVSARIAEDYCYEMNPASVAPDAHCTRISEIYQN